MPGIASDRGGVSAATIAAPGVQVTPAIADFMQAFRQGAITTDDLIKRGFQLPAEVEQARQTTQDLREIAPLRREAQKGALTSEIELQPRKQELQAGQLNEAIRALPTEAEQQASEAERAKNAQIRNSLVSTVPGVREKTIAGLSNEQVFDLWTAAHGQPPPEKIEIPGEGGVSEPAPIDEWYVNNFGNVPEGVSGKDFYERPDIQARYQAYVKEAKNRPLTLFKGTDEYNARLREDLKETNLKEAIQGLKLKAVGTGFEAQAKASAESPAKALTEAKQARTTYGTRQEIQDLRKVQAAYYKMKNILDPKEPPSAPKDQAAIFSWMKILDPGSTVREGEYATAKNARGVPDSIRAWLNQAIDGQILSPEQRKLFGQAVEPIYQGQVQAATPTINQFLQEEENLDAPTGSIVPPEDAALAKKFGKPNAPAAKHVGIGAETGGATPSAGTKRVIQNGVTFEWNGTQYVPLQ